jgi:hypothetical protein
MSWIMTSTGRRIDYLNPDPEQISIFDICTALSRNHRFGGHCPIKVAQHLLEVLNLMLRRATEENPEISEKDLAEIALVALLHDFPEYAVTDCPTPLKRLLGSAYAEIEDRLLVCMQVKWDLVEVYQRWTQLLKWADQEAVEQEAIRYKLDGYVMDQDLVRHKVPNVWVPEDKPINLNTAIWPEELVSNTLGQLFVRYMILSGRYELLEPHFHDKIEALVESTGVSVEQIAREPLPLPSVFIDHPGFF